MQRRRQPVSLAALLFGIVFLVIGVLGFAPIVTTQYDEMQFAGYGSDSKLFGLFQVSVIHNVVHLLFGAAGVGMARTVWGSQMYLLYGGAIYGALALYGIAIDQQSGGNFLPVNTADNVLHLALAIFMGALAIYFARQVMTQKNKTGDQG